MSDIHVHRDHSLGLERARKVAEQWASYAAQKLELTCEVQPGEQHDVIEFSRSGVKGRLRVDAAGFDLDISLGLLFKAFAGQIKTETCRRLDEAIAREQAQR